MIGVTVSRFHGRACFARSLGLSAPGPGPRTSEQIVAEAYALLEGAGLTADPAGLVLVGHSFGGYNGRLLRARHPGLVRALLLVDPAPPLIGAAPAAAAAGVAYCEGCHAAEPIPVFWAMRLVAPFGAAHPLFASGLPTLVSSGFGALASLPPAAHAEYLRPLMGWRYYDTNLREAYWWPTSEWQVLSAKLSPADLRACLLSVASHSPQLIFFVAPQKWQTGTTADVRRPQPPAAASPAAMGGAGGDGSMGAVPYVLFTATRGLERGWRLADGSVCFDFGTYGDRAASLAACPPPRYPTDVNLTVPGGEWVEVESSHFVPMYEALAAAVARKAVELVQRVRQ
eukprot:SAG22_NODE_1687_length_3809_cov_11.008356_2_plen_342_part_00